MSEHLKVRVTATGSTDAADKAKAVARSRGLRVQTVASVRLTTAAHKFGFDPSRTAASWTVVLAVRSAA